MHPFLFCYFSLYLLWMKKIRQIVFLVMSIGMIGLMTFGVYALFTAPQKAKIAQEELEARILENQRIAEELKQKQLEKAQQARENATYVTNEPEETSPEGYRLAKNMRLTIIGDSTMVAALPSLYEEMPNAYIDARFGRTILEGIEILKDLEANNQIGEALVFSLITNSFISEENVEELIAHSQGRPTFWLSTYGVANDSNEVCNRVIRKYDNAFFIDWESLAMANRAAYISSDALHPNEEGSKAYAKLIADTITRDLGRYHEERRRKDGVEKN